MLQTLEKKIAEYNLQVGEYKHQILALRETSEQEKTGLRKAITSQKRKAAHFEETVKNLTSRIREHVSDYTVSNVALCSFKLKIWEIFTFGKWESCLFMLCLHLLFFVLQLRKNLL